MLKPSAAPAALLTALLIAPFPHAAPSRAAWAEELRAGEPRAEEPRAEEQSDTLTVTGTRDPLAAPSDELDGRAATAVRDGEVRERVARSTPEALQGVAGVYVQQTAHGQASAYIRGRTGRHTLLMVDGFRLTHALFRQGPNQYLFTIDPLSVARIEVLRGGGSVWLGANALSGAALVQSKEPSLLPGEGGARGARGALTLQRTGADEGLGGRAEVDVTLARGFGLYLSAGGVTRGQLEASGALPLKPGLTAAQRLEKSVPRFEDDGRTQMGTGYDALSADAAARLKLGGALRGEWVAAARLFRQLNAPRTDQCPPSEAPESWCLTYNEQFRTHAYTRLTLSPRLALVERAEGGLSFQRQHERRTNDRVNYQNIGSDAVGVWEGRLKARTRPLELAGGALRLHYGLDGTSERVESRAWTRLVRSSITRQDSRGQYLDGSAYLRGEGWAGARWRRAGEWGEWRARLGARLSAARAEAPEDLKSSSRAISRGWVGPTYGGGLAWSPPSGGALSLHLNIEQGLAAPNLDDLTARQLTGQGYQVENPDLAPERATTYELGARLRALGAEAELWGFAMELLDGIERRDAQCPPTDFGCQGSRTAPPFTLVNLSGAAWMFGFEHALTWSLPLGFSVREHVSYSWGEGPSPLVSEPSGRRPLSRVPPLNGASSLRWGGGLGDLWGAPLSGYVGYEARWARAATRLSFGDELDQRVPYGGTPGYLVHNALFGLRWGEHELLGVAENLSDVPYRVHGSSVNGAARSVNLSLRLAL